MSAENWKLEKDLCRCCHSEGRFKNLAEPFKITELTDLTEIYADLLKECYDIDMGPVPGMLSAVTYTICEVCIMRLRDASEFKKQVLSCEERFRDMYDRNVFKAVTSVEIEVKQEILDSEPDDDFKEDLSLDDNDDDDYEESMDTKINEEADEKPLKVEVPKKGKDKARKTVKSAAVKSKKKMKRKNLKGKNLKEEPAETENDAEAKQDRVAAPLLSAGRFLEPFGSEGQVVAPKFFLRDEDYKQEGDVYHCAKCEKTYNKIDSLRTHVKLKHYKIPRFKCSICIEEFMTLPLLTVHKLEVHNVDERVKCSLCDRIFNTNALFRRHLNNFHMLGEVGERYKCEFCDYVTFKYVDMYKHNFKHKTVKDNHCRFCKKSFIRRSTLKLHERIHTGDRRKVCTVCGQAFVQKASLNYHMTKYHPEVNF